MLQSLQYIDSGGAVQLKGRVACQISSHELLLTELLFENALSPLAPEESAALLSCLVFTQNTQVEPHITNTLQEVKRRFFLCYTNTILMLAYCNPPSTLHPSMAHCSCNILLKDQAHYRLHVVYPGQTRPLCVSMCCEIAVIHETAL